MYTSLNERSPRWEPEEFVSNKENWLLNKQREAFNAEIEKVEKAAQIQPVGPNAAPDKEATEKIETEPPNTANTEEKNVPQVVNQKNLQNESSGVLPPVLVANQKSIIHFQHNSNELPQNAYETLDNIVKFSSQRPDLIITVEGYTDSYGDPDYNRQLSKYRAEIVKYYLIGQGVSASKIEALGRGNENPLKSNDTFEGRKQNRRVEIIFNSK